MSLGLRVSRRWSAFLLAAAATLVSAAFFATFLPISDAVAVTPSIDRLVVAVTSPTAGATLSGTAVTLTAHASQELSSGTFTVDGASVATVTAAQGGDALTWTAMWNSTGVADGAYAVTFMGVRASDSATATAAPVSVTVDNGSSTFSVTVTAPAASSTLTGATRLAATTSAAADSVSFVVTPTGGGGPVSVPAAGAGTAWSASWNSADVPNGEYALFARAFHGGVMDVSDTRNVIVHNDGVVVSLTASLNTPANGTSVSGMTPLSATTDVAASAVTFTVHNGAGAVVSTLVAAGAAGTSWTATWDTTAVPNGAYSVKANATKDGSSADTAVHDVTVANVVTPPPASMTVTLAAPASGATLSGTVPLYAHTSATPDSVVFIVTQGFGDHQATVIPATGAAATWTASWNAASAQNGAYTVAVRATKGVTESSSPDVSVTLANPLPGPGTGGTPPAPPVTPPSTVPLVVSLSSPTAGVTLSGTTTLVAHTNVAAGSLIFVLRNPSTSEVTPVATVPATSGAGGTSWIASIDTATVPNGAYALLARANKDGTIVQSTPSSVIVANATSGTAEPVAYVVTLPVLNAQLTGAVTLSATSNRALDGFTFTIRGVAAGSAAVTVPAAGNSTKTVWNASWDTSSVPNGDYVLTTVAVKAGHETHNEPRAFKVANTSVSVTITSPSNNAEISGAKEIVVAAVPAATSVAVKITSATNDAMTSVRNASFDVGRQVWVSQWNTLDFPDGSYRVDAKGAGSQGREFLAAPVTVQVANGASATTKKEFGIRIVSPSGGATIEGTVGLAAVVAGDAVGVQFFASPIGGGAIVRVEGHFDTIKKIWMGLWKSGDSPSGPFSIGAVAINAQNIKVESEPVQVTVANGAKETTPPAPAPLSVRLSEPADGNVSGRVRFVAQTEGTAASVRVYVHLRGSTREPRALQATFDAAHGRWVAEWDTVPEEVGTYEAVAVAKNAAGHETTSPNVATLYIERREPETPAVPPGEAGTPAPIPEKPQFAIVHPAADAVVRGNVVITASGTDAAGVSFAVRGSDGATVFHGEGVKDGGAWSTLWDTTGAKDGRYLIEAVAMANGGDRLATSRVGVAVANAAERQVVKVDVVPSGVVRQVMSEMPSGSVALPVEQLPKGSVDAGAQLDAECAANRIPAGRCRSWLAMRHQSPECRDAGIMTKEECLSFLKRRNGGVFTDCQGRSDQVCAQAVAEKTAGLLDATAMHDLKDAVTPNIGKTLRVEPRVPAAPAPGTSAPPAPVITGPQHEEAPKDFADLVPLVSDQTLTVGVHASPQYADAGDKASHQSVPAVLFVDSDGDGLPDDLELRIGTDPKNPDTDGDGYSDGTEVQLGYNPRGKGRLSDGVRALAPVDIAVVSGAPIEQPRNAGAASDVLRVDSAATATSDVSVAKLRLRGHAKPGEIVTIFVYSYLPVVFTTTTKDDGTWSYDLGSSLADGEHEAYATVTDETGKIKSKSNPLAFFVAEAKAVGPDEFYKPEDASPLAAATLQAPIREVTGWYFGAAGILIVFALLVSYLLFMRPKGPPPRP